MPEKLRVTDMGVEHIEAFGKMLCDMVAEAPQNFSASLEYVREYATGERFMKGMSASIKRGAVGRFVALDEFDVCVAGVECVAREDGTIGIANMYVQPAVRSRGLGYQLLEACEDRAQHDGITQTSLVVGSENYGAQLLYEARGYAEPDPPVHNPWELHHGIFGILLVKDLTN